MMIEHRALIVILRVVGVLCCAAIIASVMPRSWITGIHEWLGLGEFPNEPIAEYLARSVSGLYVILGGVTIALSMDVRHYAPIIRFYAIVSMGFGVLLVAIDVTSGMPMYWVLSEGPTAIVLGLVIHVLARRVRQ